MDFLRTESLLLDAAMGTALIGQGLKGRAPEWNLTRPELVREVHLAHVAAGAQVVLTNTFTGATAEEAAAAVRLARESGAKRVAGSLWAGLPDLARQIDQLRETDAIWLESATSAEQALAAVKTAAARTRLPIAITCALEKAPLQALRDAGASAAGYNCTPWPTDAAGADVVKPDSAGIVDPAVWAAKIPAARLRGGCCGTDARYLAALRATSR
ncbi:MAG: homocysteine S-methyltransferase family protein [Myxococcales bacterium]